MNKLTKKLTTLSILTVIPFFLTGCFHNSNTATQPTTQTLTIWRLNSDEKVFRQLIAAFEKQNPSVKVNYRTFAPTDEYEKSVINALAAGAGPDIWEIRNDELARHKDKLVGFELSEAAIASYKQNYAPPISEEMIADGKIYGLPLGIDPLILYVNTKHLKEAKIEALPKTWQEAVETAGKLTIKEGDRIVRSGFALGLASNVDRASDILQLIMLQLKTQMVEPAHRTATFDLYTQDAATGAFVFPGKSAFTLYGSFAAPNSPLGNYSWNLEQTYSTAAFVQENASMMINYFSIEPQIRSLNPKLQFVIGPVPQYERKTVPAGDVPGGISKPIYTAKYRALVISKPPVTLSASQQEAKTNLARSFVHFATLPATVKSYTEKQKNLVSPLIVSDNDQSQQSDQSLMSTKIGKTINPYLVTWYKGLSPRTVDQVMLAMIQAVMEQGRNLDETFAVAAKQVTSILQ